jgi:hypothetical protein
MNIRPPRETGRKTLQVNIISWSNLYLGKLALTHRKRSRQTIILAVNQTIAGTPIHPNPIGAR